MPSSRPVTLITGGAQGIGRAIAESFLAARHAVVVIDIDAQAVTEAEAELGAHGDCLVLQGDVALEQDVAVAIERAVARFGRLDHVINNAGIGHNAPVTALGMEEWNRVLAVNLGSVFLTAKHAAPHLSAARGAMVNIGSTRAHMSEANTEAYSASKGGIVALTHALAVSLGPAIRVNCISPGWIEVRDWQRSARRESPALRPVDHAQHPAGRVGRPADVAELALYLCSDKAGFITGQEFVVDGGMMRKMIYVE